jgi:serine/threonine protein kinase
MSLSVRPPLVRRQASVLTPTRDRLEIDRVRRLGPYELIRRLDDGAVGERWVAQRAARQGPVHVTLELFHGRILAVPEVRSRLFDEARRTIGLHHANIVSPAELVEFEGSWALVFEAFEGVTLAELAARVRNSGQRMNYALVAYIVGELLRGLACAHERTIDGRPAGVIHGGITPRELLLSSAGTVAVTHFGLARIAAEFVRAPTAMRYMPPEQLVGAHGPSLDLFAVGGILHELLDGQEFRVQASDEAQLYGAIRDGQTAPLGPQHADYPVQLEALRAGLLQPRVEFRIPSARDALALLGEWPGYRNASQDLAGLVRNALGLAPPSGPPIRREPSATVIIDHSKLMVEPSPPRHAQPAVDGLPPADPELDDEQRTPVATIVLIAGMVVLGLGFVVVGIGFAIGWWGPNARSEPEPELAQTQAAVPEPPPPAPEPELPGGELTPEVEGVVAPAALDAPSGPLPGAELTPEIENKPSPSDASAESDGPSGTGSSTASGRKGVSVTFKESHYATLQLKVDSRVITFDDRKDVTLAPGSHTLSLREGDDQPWRPAGKINLEAGERYEITLLDPPLAMVEML